MNTRVFNAIGKSITSKISKTPAILSEEKILQEQLSKAALEFDKILVQGKKKYNRVRSRYGMKPLSKDGDNFDEWRDKLEQAKATQKSIENKIWTINRKYNSKQGSVINVSDWKRGMNIINRPQTSTQYFDTGIDQIRQMMYHEFGHHVHQISKLTTKATYRNPLIEKQLTDLKNKGIINIDKSVSNYAGKNDHEWFAENFSLYFNDRKDLVDPEFKTLIKEIMENAQ
jgi:hypothetical protein